MPKDYYRILGVSPEAGEDEIRMAFERVSSKLGSDYRGEELLAEVEEAYSVLSDPQSRAEYHRLYKIFGGLAGQFDGLDLFREKAFLRGLKRESPLFSWGEGGAIDWELEGEELDSPMVKDLIDALKSALINLINGQNGGPTILKDEGGQNFSRAHVYVDLFLQPGEVGYKFLDYHCYIQCAVCSGRGSRQGGPLVDCLACLNLKNKQSCLVCAGLGKHPEENCPKCKGEGRVMARRQVEVKIPKNVKHNSIIQVAGAGHHGFRGLKEGDLFIKVLLTDERGDKANRFE